MTREQAALEMAKAMGWVYAHGAGDRSDSMGCFYWDIIDNEPGDGFDVPNSDAPLHEHLAFVGRVAQALGTDTFRNFGGVWKERRAPEWRVAFDREGRDFGCNGFAPDLSWAAMLAAIEARRAR